MADGARRHHLLAPRQASRSRGCKIASGLPSCRGASPTGRQAHPWICVCTLGARRSGARVVVARFGV